MPNVGQTFIEVEADKRSIAKYNRTLKNLESNSKRSANKIESSFTSSFAKIAGAAIALRSAFNFAVAAKNAARDAEEIQNKFNTVFENVADDAKKVRDSFATNFGLATSSANKLLSATGDLLVGFGFTEESALDLSDQVNRLAVDLASFTNLEGGAERASEALTKALLGETESAKSLGIVIRQNTKEFREQVKQVARAQGITEQQAKSVVILNQAYQQSGKAVGDFARTQNSLANQERILNEQLKETQELIGRDLQTSFLTIIKFIGDFNRELSDTSSALSVVGSIGKVVASIFIVISRGLKAAGTQLGGVSAALAQLVQLEFSAAAEAIAITFNKQVDNLVGVKDDLVSIWSGLDGDIAKAIQSGDKGSTRQAIQSLTGETEAETGSLAAVNKDLDLLNEKISKTTDPKLLTSLVQQAVILEDQINRLENRINDIREGFRPTAGVGEAPSDELEDIEVDDSLLEIDLLSEAFSDIGTAATEAGRRIEDNFIRAIASGKSFDNVLQSILGSLLEIGLRSAISFATGGVGGSITDLVSGLFKSTQSTQAASPLTVGVNQINSSVQALNTNLQLRESRPQVIQVQVGDKTLVEQVVIPQQNRLGGNEVDNSDR